MSKKNPLKIIGAIFAAIAAVEGIVLIGFLLYYSFAEHKPPLVVMLSVLVPHVLIFGGIGVGFLWHIRRREALREELLSGGYYEVAQVVRVEQVRSVTLNNRHPFKVICRIDRGDALHEYRSDMYSDDPSLQPGDNVKIYLDRRNEDRYYVDVPSAAPVIVRHG